MKTFISIICILVSVIGLSDIRKSMLAANMLEYIETQDRTLPEGITAVEYIQSTGTQWIKVGQVIGMTSISVRLAASEIPSSGCFKAFGIGYWVNFGDDCGIDYYGMWGGNYNHIGCELGVFVNIIYDAPGRWCDSMYMGGNGTAFISSADKGRNLFLFCGTNGTNPYITGSGNYMAWRGMIASCVVMSDTIKLVDMVAVKFINELGVEEGGMYDFVSETLFRNGGSGSFIIGPDL